MSDSILTHVLKYLIEVGHVLEKEDWGRTTNMIESLEGHINTKETEDDHPTPILIITEGPHFKVF